MSSTATAQALIKAVPLLHYDIMDAGIIHTSQPRNRGPHTLPYSRYDPYEGEKHKLAVAFHDLAFETYVKLYLPQYEGAQLSDYHCCTAPGSPAEAEALNWDEDYCSEHCLVPNPEPESLRDVGMAIIKKLGLPKRAELVATPDSEARFWLRMAQQLGEPELVELIECLTELESVPVPQIETALYRLQNSGYAIGHPVFGHSHALPYTPPEVVEQLHRIRTLITPPVRAKSAYSVR